MKGGNKDAILHYLYHRTDSQRAERTDEIIKSKANYQPGDIAHKNRN